eukprot:11624983-Alexandrium_andersonii.AAC.1
MQRRLEGQVHCGPARPMGRGTRAAKGPGRLFNRVAATVLQVVCGAEAPLHEAGRLCLAATMAPMCL